MTRCPVLIGALVVPLLLTGCETPVPENNFPEISFTHEQPIRLDVATVTVKEPPPPAVGGKSIDYELPVSLRKTAARWARERLKPVGRTGEAVVTVEQADVTEERLKKTGGIRGAFVTDQTERYRGVLRMSVAVTTPRGEAVARAQGERVRTVAEDATLADREKIWFEMTETLMRRVDKELDGQIRRHMSNYVR